MPLLPDTSVVAPLAVVFGLVLIRIAFLMISSPIFSASLIPKKVLAAVIAVVSFASFMGLSHRPLVPMELTVLIPAGLGEAAVGAAAGLSVRIIFAAIEGAGQLIGVPMGLGFSQAVDPMTNNGSVVTSRFLGVVVGLVFLVMDGHHVLLRMISRSFDIVAPGAASLLSVEVGMTILQKASLIFKSSVQLAAPVLLVLLGVMVALGLLARVAPKVNLFVLSFAISITVGLIALRAAMPNIMVYVRWMVSRTEPMMAEVLGKF